MVTDNLFLHTYTTVGPVHEKVYSLLYVRNLMHTPHSMELTAFTRLPTGLEDSTKLDFCEFVSIQLWSYNNNYAWNLIIQCTTLQLPCDTCVHVLSLCLTLFDIKGVSTVS